MPAFATPAPYRVPRTFWSGSIFDLDVSELPARADSTALLEALADHTEEVLGVTHLAFDPYGQDDWNESWTYTKQARYFIDSGPASGLRTWTQGTPSMGDGQAHERTHLYDGVVGGLRQENAIRNPFTGGYLVASSGDRHFCVYSTDTTLLSEGIGYTGTSPTAAHCVTWDLDDAGLDDLPIAKNGYSPAGATAARIPFTPHLFTNQDAVDCGTTGDLGHTLGIILTETQDGWDWPARFGDGALDAGPKTGAWFRLKASVNPNTLIPDGPNAQRLRAIARTLKKYGAIVYDKTTGNLSRLVSPNDPAWPESLNFGSLLQWDLFEIVDVSSVRGDNNSIRVLAEPTDNLPPVADATGTPTTGPAPLEVTFSSSGTVDPDGSIVSREWAFGDGDTGSGASPTHTYTEPGVYTAVLTVTDDDGASDTDGVTITVLEPPPTDPVAVPVALPVSGNAPLAVAFDGSGSYDSRGHDITSYHWDFDDGDTATGYAVTHEYAEPGTYHPTLTVISSDDPPTFGDEPMPMLLVAPHDAPEPIRDRADLVLEGDADNEQIADLVVAASNELPGGTTSPKYGGLLFAEGHVVCEGPILLPGRGFAMKAFSYNTIIIKAASFTDGGIGSTPALVKIADTVAGNKATTVLIDGFTFFGQYRSGGESRSSGTPSGAIIAGISLVINDNVSAAETLAEFGAPTGIASGDNNSRVENIQMYGVSIGVHIGGSGERAFQAENVNVMNVASGGKGYDIDCSDSLFERCKTITDQASSAAIGFHVRGGNSVLKGCKASYFNNVGSYGFDVSSSRCTLDVEAQDNRNGIRVTGDQVDLKCRVDNQEAAYGVALDLSSADKFNVEASIGTRTGGGYDVGIRLPNDTSYGKIDAVIDPTVGGGIDQPVTKGSGDTGVTNTAGVPANIEAKILVVGGGVIRRELANP